MRKTKKGSKGKAKYVVFAFIIAIIIIIIIVAVVAAPNQSKTPLTSEYLKVSHTKSIGEFSNNNKTVRITALGLNVTAIAGDAHTITIIVDSQPEGSEDGFGPPDTYILKKGESWLPGIQLNGYVTDLIQKDGEPVFPLEIQIGCHETREEKITLYIKPEDIVSTGYTP